MENKALTITAIGYVFIITAFLPIIMEALGYKTNRFTTPDPTFDRAFDSAKNLVIAAIGIPLGIVLFYMGFSWFKTGRLIENIPTSKIRGLAMGPVEIFGKVVAASGGLIKAPGSDKGCVYYKYVKEESGSPKREIEGWKIVEKGENRTYFFLDDGTGCVLIDPAGADIEAPDNDKLAFLSQTERPAAFGRKRYVRYRDYRLVPGDEVYVMGMADKNPFNTKTATNHTANIIIRKNKKNMFYISRNREKYMTKEMFRLSMNAIATSFIIIVGSVIINLFPYY